MSVQNSPYAQPTCGDLLIAMQENIDAGLIEQVAGPDASPRYQLTDAGMAAALEILRGLL